jgi:hypothetical protein
MASNNSQSVMLVGMYTKLSKLVETVNTLLVEYSKGNIYAVANILTPKTYNSFSVSFASLAANSSQYPEYENIRKSIAFSLAGLYKSILQYSEYVNVQAQLDLAQQKVNILYNPELLKEYISTMRGNRQIFPESVVQAPVATLKPEYAEYIKLYGFPEGAVFDPDKLAGVLRQIKV